MRGFLKYDRTTKHLLIRDLECRKIFDIRFAGNNLLGVIIVNTADELFVQMSSEDARKRYGELPVWIVKACDSSNLKRKILNGGKIKITEQKPERYGEIIFIFLYSVHVDCA